jgi:hypothetical protein
MQPAQVFSLDRQIAKQNSEANPSTEFSLNQPTLIECGLRHWVKKS